MERRKGKARHYKGDHLGSFFAKLPLYTPQRTASPFPANHCGKGLDKGEGGHMHSEVEKKYLPVSLAWETVDWLKGMEPLQVHEEILGD